MVEKGTHGELMAKQDGAYAALANMQLSAHAQAAAKAPDRRGSVLEIAQEAAELGKLAATAAPHEPQASPMTSLLRRIISGFWRSSVRHAQIKVHAAIDVAALHGGSGDLHHDVAVGHTGRGFAAARRQEGDTAVHDHHGSSQRPARS